MSDQDWRVPFRELLKDWQRRLDGYNRVPEAHVYKVYEQELRLCMKQLNAAIAKAEWRSK